MVEDRGSIYRTSGWGERGRIDLGLALKWGVEEQGLVVTSMGNIS